MGDLRNRILNSQDRPSRTEDIEGWGTLEIRACPVGSLKYTAFVHQTDKKGNPPPIAEMNQRRIVGACILSAHDPETGDRIFEWGDAETLREKNWNRVVKVAEISFDLAAEDQGINIDEGKASSGSDQTSD